MLRNSFLISKIKKFSAISLKNSDEKTQNFLKISKNIVKFSIDIGQKTLCIRYGPLKRTQPRLQKQLHFYVKMSIKFCF